jgi:hypothetical protein
MYDLLLKAGAPALIALALICMISSGTEFNGTTYILGEREAEVIVPINASELNLTLSENVGNMTLLDENGKSVPFNSSYEFWQGDYAYSLSFERHVTGRLIYNVTLMQSQQFVLPIKDRRPVRIILPEGYTTGDRSLGIARPPPDAILAEDAGSVLTWNNTTSILYIEVDYYRKSAPQALTLIFSILALAGLALLVEYYVSIRKLRASRIAEEDEMKNKTR